MPSSRQAKRSDDKPVALEIIDFEVRGNVVRFYLGENGSQWGDDWNDMPYEHNAGAVYDEYVKGKQDVNFAFDDYVLEPCDGHANSNWCKEDMIKRKVPCVVVLRAKGNDGDWRYDNFDAVLGNPKAEKYYFGDTLPSEHKTSRKLAPKASEEYKEEL